MLDHLAAGSPVILEIELQGARQVRASDARGAARLPGPADLGRAGPPADRAAAPSRRRSIEKRLALAREELAAEAEFDVTLVNTNVEESSTRLVALAVAPGD